MALDAGSISIKIIAETMSLTDLQKSFVSLTQKVEVLEDKLKKTNKTSKESEKGFGDLGKIIKDNLVSSFLSANAIYDISKKALDLLIDTVKEGIVAYGEQVKQENLLSNALQRTGQFSQETFESMKKYASQLQDTVGVEDDAVIQAQRLFIQFGANTKQVNALTEATLDLATAKSMDFNSAADLVAKTIGSEVNALGRYGVSVKNAKTETEKISQVLDGISKLFGGSASAAAQTLEGRMKTLKTAQGEFAETLGQAVAPALKIVTEQMIVGVQGITKFISESKNMTILQNIIKGTVFYVQILIDYLLLTPRLLMDLGKAFLSLGIAVGKFFKDIFSGKGLKEGLNDAFDTLKDFGKGIIEEYKSLGKKTAEGFTKAFLDNSKDLPNPLNKITGEDNNGAQKLGTGVKGSASGVSALVIPPPNTKQAEDALEIFKNKYLNHIQDMANATSQIMGNIGQIISNAFEDQQTKLQDFHETEIDNIQKRYERELELIENNGVTKDEALANQLASLQDNLTRETDETKKADLDKQISETQKQIAIRKLEADTTAAKKKSDKDYAKEKYKLDVEMFNTKKALDITNATISFAMGLVSLWASVWSVGNPIAAAIIGGVMSGLLTGIFATNVAIIASQPPPPPPKFARGTGFAPGGMSIVGEQGPEAISVPRGSTITTARDTERQFGNTMINATFIVEGESIPIRKMLINNRENEAYRQ